MEATETTVQETVADSAPVDNAPVVEESGLGESPVEATAEAEETGLGEAEVAEDAEPSDETLGAPEGDYTLEGIELPEGVQVDSHIAEQFGDICRDLNLSQSAYQKIVAKMGPVMAERQAARLEEVKKEFLAQGRADKDMGGANWATTKAEASKAYVKFVDPETRAFLKQTGLDCHPGIIRAFHNVQKAVADDTVVRGQASSGKPDPAKAFFYNSNMN
jgi:hypothetical protein